MRFEQVDWDEANLEHATRHGVSATEIEQAIGNAERAMRGKAPDRRLLRSQTDGGRRVAVVVQLLDRGRVRPITAWEERR